MWIHFGMVECRIPFLGHCDLDLCPGFRIMINHVGCISPILFEVGIPNLVYDDGVSSFGHCDPDL